MSGKQAKQFIAIIVALIVCVVGYFGVDYYCQAKKEKAEEESSKEAAQNITTVFEMAQVEDIKEFSYNVEGNTLSFKRQDDGTWQYEQDSSVKLNDDTINSKMLTEVIRITSETVMEEPEDINQYGFDNPTNTIVIKDVNNNTHTFTIGAMNDFSPSIYYLMVDNDKNVYAVNSSISLAFSKTIDDIKAEEETTEEETTVEDVVEETTTK